MAILMRVHLRLQSCYAYSIYHGITAAANGSGAYILSSFLCKRKQTVRQRTRVYLYFTCATGRRMKSTEQFHDSMVKVSAETLANIDKGAPKPLATFHGCRDKIFGLDFHPSLPQLATSTADGFVTLWNYQEEGRAIGFVGHRGAVNDIQFSETGDLMTSGADDGTIRFWVPRVGGEVRSFKGHTARVQSVCFNPRSSEMIATASNDKTIKLWSIDWKSKFPEGRKSCNKIDKRKLAKGMELRRRSAGHVQTFLKCFPKIHRNWVRSIRFSRDGNLLISASDDRSIAVLDIRSYEVVAKIHFYLESSPTFAAFDPCAGHYVGSSTTDRGFLVHDLRNRQPVQVFQDIHQGVVHSFAFHPSGDYAVTVGDDAMAKILDLVEGRPIYTLQGAVKDLYRATFSRDGDLLATGGKGRQLIVWKTLLDPYKDDEEEEGERESETRNVGWDDPQPSHPNVSPSSLRSPYVWKEPVETFSTNISRSSSVQLFEE